MKRQNTHSFYTADPIYFKHSMSYVTGGIQRWIDHLHDRQNYGIPLQKMAYILYNMVKEDIYDPSVFENFALKYQTVAKTNLTSRHAFGALWACYKSNQATVDDIHFWASLLQDNSDNTHAQEVSELL